MHVSIILNNVALINTNIWVHVFFTLFKVDLLKKDIQTKDNTILELKKENDRLNKLICHGMFFLQSIFLNNFEKLFLTTFISNRFTCTSAQM